jgi:hypothetical protein
MNVPYTVFLQTHLNYLIERMFALKGEEQQEMIESIKRVRNLLNLEEEINNNNFVYL